MTAIDKVEQALILIRQCPEKCDFMGPRTEELIQAAEQALAFRLPPSCRRFVTELGAGGAGSQEIYGVIDSDFVTSGVPNGIWLTLKHRTTSVLPATMVIIHADGMGGYFVLDTAKPDFRGEPPVEVWEPGASQPGDKLEYIAPDFGSWFLDAVQFGLRDR